MFDFQKKTRGLGGENEKKEHQREHGTVRKVNSKSVSNITTEKVTMRQFFFLN